MSLSRYGEGKHVLYAMLGLSLISWGAGAAARRKTHLREFLHVFLVP